MGRHISERDTGQRTDIDADLHGRRTAQHIDWRFAIESDVLEPELVFFDFVEGTVVWITSELSGVFYGTQAERLEVDRVECSSQLFPVEPCAGIKIGWVRLDKAAETCRTNVGEGLGEDPATVFATEPTAFEPKVQSQPQRSQVVEIALEVQEVGIPDEPLEPTRNKTGGALISPKHLQ